LTGGTTIRSIVVNVEPLGSLRLPNTNMVDLRATKRTRLGGGRSLELRVDVFNVLNGNWTTVRVLRSGPEFLKAGIPFTGALTIPQQATILPRILQFGAAFSF